MRVLCRHGHFSFYPRQSGDINRFAQSFGVTLKREEDYYTFERLQGAPKYSLLGKLYINLPALTTFEGNPWDVMRENNFVYNVQLGLIVPKLSVLGLVELTQSGYFFMANVPLLQPGVRTILGRQIMSYSGEFYDDRFYLRILEFDYE
jgi:hypothetical protein